MKKFLCLTLALLAVLPFMIMAEENSPPSDDIGDLEEEEIESTFNGTAISNEDDDKSGRSKRSTFFQRYCSNRGAFCNSQARFKIISLRGKYNAKKLCEAYSSHYNCFKAIDNLSFCRVTNLGLTKRFADSYCSKDCQCELAACDNKSLSYCSTWYCRRNAFIQCGMYNSETIARFPKSIKICPGSGGLSKSNCDCKCQCSP
ncbi:DgyrCDS1652 [Dimorphilus gyrociliatus]|uniref:DgyrCDS1652 n=1 Tax=Dimorphilus gyrociliatus TaxID=2664684 RepID=A0A7I8V871_9ANNE|nr:DgyrCDS1652 [Dimorphilus gyrociliatus]